VVEYSAVMELDAALLSWLQALDVWGVALMRGLPVREGPVPALQQRAGFERLTHYGPGYSVVVRPDPANISHTHHRIFFHTDLTYYDHMPGAVFLHCIEQHPGEGGETMLADGFEAARQLRAARPEVATITSLTRRWDDESVTNTWN